MRKSYMARVSFSPAITSLDSRSARFKLVTTPPCCSLFTLPRLRISYSITLPSRKPPAMVVGLIQSIARTSEFVLSGLEQRHPAALESVNMPSELPIAIVSSLAVENDVNGLGADVQIVDTFGGRRIVAILVSSGCECSAWDGSTSDVRWMAG